MGRWHAHAVERVGGRVVAIVDTDTDRGAALATRLSSRPVVESELGRALRGHAVVVLHVCTPLATHVAIVAVALEVGVLVMAAMPLTHVATACATRHSL